MDYWVTGSVVLHSDKTHSWEGLKEMKNVLKEIGNGCLDVLDEIRNIAGDGGSWSGGTGSRTGGEAGGSLRSN